MIYPAIHETACPFHYCGYDGSSLQHGFDSYFGIPYSNDMSKGKLPLIEGNEVIEREPDQSQLTKRYPIYASDQFWGKSDGGLYGDVIEEIDWSVGQGEGAELEEALFNLKSNISEDQNLLQDNLDLAKEMKSLMEGFDVILKKVARKVGQDTTL